MGGWAWSLEQGEDGLSSSTPVFTPGESKLAPLLSEYISQTLFAFLLKKEYFFYEQHFILMLRKQQDPIIMLRRMEIFAALSGTYQYHKRTAPVLFFFYIIEL